MVARSREWLQSFLKLGAWGSDAVRPADIERQEDTVLRALHLLDDVPGVVLADEVGMGKTYEALGVVAAKIQDNPSAHVLILTPGADLNIKWKKEAVAFGDKDRPIYSPFRDNVVTADSLGELARALRTNRVVVAPMNVFAGSRSWVEQGFLLGVWGRSKGLAGTQLAAVHRRYREGKVDRVDPTRSKFLDTFEWADIEPIVEAALADQNDLGAGSLDHLFENGYSAFEDTRAVDSALADLRFRMVARLIPQLDLLVVDEAHKLKNPVSVRATGLRRVFKRKFDKALFLTATPFQLSVTELRQVFELFALASSAPPDLRDRADRFLGDVEAYQGAYADLERTWRALDQATAHDFTRWLESDPQLVGVPQDPNLAVMVTHASRLLHLKHERIQPSFRSWMVRSLREDKRDYRKTQRRLLTRPEGSAVPFLLYERFIAQLFRSKSRTHKAAVQINMVSSYTAAREGALLTQEERAGLDAESEAYRRLLRRVLSTPEGTERGHPKIDHVVEDAILAAKGGEKTLVFCARVATLRQLKNRIQERWDEQLVELWRRVYPDASGADIFDRISEEDRGRGRHSLLRDRFQRSQDLLHLALRERYVSTVLGASEFAEQNAQLVAARANLILDQQRLAKTDAERFDWSTAKRCVEQATAQLLVASGAGRQARSRVIP